MSTGLRRGRRGGWEDRQRAAVAGCGAAGIPPSGGCGGTTGGLGIGRGATFSRAGDPVAGADGDGEDDRKVFGYY